MMIRSNKHLYLKSLNRRLRSIKQKPQRDKKPAEESINLSKVQSFQVDDIDDYQHLFAILADRKPIKIISSYHPSFENPKTVKAIISHTTNRNQHNQHKDAIQIPYQKEQQTDSLFAEIPFQQFQTYQGQYQLSVAQMPLGRQKVALPKYVQEYFSERKTGINFSSIQSINLWYYKGDRISTWHYDGHDNFLYVKEGYKEIHLAPPNFKSKHSTNQIRSKSVFDINWNHKLQTSAWPSSEVYFTKVKAGQTLFIPRGWWHHVISFGQPNIALNVWGNSIKKDIGEHQLDIYLRHVTFQMSQLLCKETADWQSIGPQMKEEFRLANFLLYFNRNLRNQPKVTVSSSSD